MEKNNFINWGYWALTLTMLLSPAIALAADIPQNADSSIKSLTAATTLMGIIDSAIFSVGARVLAGLCILGAGWNLKEQRFAMAIVCIFAAIVIGTTPMWIDNIFNLNSNGGGSIFK